LTGAGPGPVFAGKLFPFVFITIACGALSGFHALISSGTTPKMIEKEPQIRLVGYGGMLMESSVAVMAMIAASLLEPGLYYAMNAPAGLLGATAQSASQAVANLGFTIMPDQLTAAAKAVQEQTLIARTGGAPTLAVGMSQILSDLVGGDALKAFWYHFAIMFEALFILTTVGAGTRVGRFMLQDTIGNIWKPFARTSWKPGLWLPSAAVVLAWGYFLWMGVEDPLGGIDQLFPLFGIANQLLAAVALTLGTVILVNSGKLRYAWVTGVPLAWDAAVTLTASYQKVFSDDPKIGFFSKSSSSRTRSSCACAPCRRAGTRRAPRPRTSARPSWRPPDCSPRRPRNVSSSRPGEETTMGVEVVAWAVRSVHWYLRELTGETAYDRYVEHHRAHAAVHGDPPLSRREFERRQAERSARPENRYC
jgi:carbon starvation protein CstA